VSFFIHCRSNIWGQFSQINPPSRSAVRGMTPASLPIEQKLLILATAMQHENFVEDTEKILSLLVEAAETIIELRGRLQEYEIRTP
jgi:hypothetical protein